MREEFLIEYKEMDAYNYISGRIKILETAFLSDATLKKLAGLPITGIYKELMETPYRFFISGSDADSISKAIFERYKAELSDMEKYVSVGFINSFFRSKAIFLKIKKYALISTNEELEERDKELISFLKTGEGDFPVIFKKAFDMMLDMKESPFKVGWLVDLFHIKYLLESAEVTRSSLIKEFFNKYAEGKLFIFLYRLSNFTISEEIDEKTFLEMLTLAVKFFPEYLFIKKLQGVKSVEQFRELSKESSLYPFTLTLANSLEEGLRKELSKVLEKCKFVSIGLEVVFMYLKLLEFEVENISMIVRGKSTGMEEKKIVERINVAYA